MITENNIIASVLSHELLAENFEYGVESIFNFKDVEIWVFLALARMDGSKPCAFVCSTGVRE
jgi:hypothetical protein